ncbi:hypothetical protein M885DRAFT_580335 [Pelagophyceae sp. CCMP2097]|nr:hypothetical protein M885DRAFT_580335 [Pelagophyceae sp. CCMP2097]
MWAQSLEGHNDIGVLSVDVAAGGLACFSKGGSPLPCSMPATMSRLGVSELMDPDFADPDSVYWSPRGHVLLVEDGGKGSMLVTDLNSVPPMSIPDLGIGQAEFTGILPHGFWHQLGPDLDAAAHLAREVEANKEQYVVNLQLHGHVEGIIEYMALGQSTQLLRIDVDADPTDSAKAMYVWLGVGFYNGRRASYCAANDCTGMRGPFVAGDVVLVSDFDILETWRGLAPGTYTDDLGAIVTDSLGFSNLEPALTFAWLGVGYYNGIRAGYCAKNDCTGMRGPFVAGEIVLVSDFAILETWRGLPKGTYTEDLGAIVTESVGFSNLEPALTFAWLGVGFYNGRRAGYCAANDCTGMRGPFVAGDVVLVSDFAILETWRGLAPGTYTDDIETIVVESLAFSNLENAGF